MTIKEIALNNPKSLIGRAFSFAQKNLEGKNRINGQSYFEHSLAVADFLRQWHLDETTITAGLLHNILRKTDTSSSKLTEEFGKDITNLAEGIAKLDLIQYKGGQPTTKTKIENLRKMILALSGDLRIVIIKLAICLHNMRSLDGVPKERQIALANETKDVYAPLAMQIGMQNLSGELYDLSFPIHDPEGYSWLLSQIKDRYETRHLYLKEVKPVLEKILIDHDLKPHRIDFRAKRYSSLYNKLPRYDMNLDNIYDLVAVWVIMNSPEECYEALGVIHKNWPPLPGRIKDYIAIPKPSGYRAIHTTVIGPDDKNIEIQLHTPQMHEENKNGLAAHWLYKQNNQENKHSSKRSIKEILKETLLLKQLRQWQEKGKNPKTNYEGFVKAMRIDFFKDHIFVLTPKGDVIDLPAEATPIDFAYKIHTDVGNSATKAKINGELKNLNAELNSGDLVEIKTQKGKKPSEEWLSFVKTSEARLAIKGFIRKKNEHLSRPKKGIRKA